MLINTLVENGLITPPSWLPTNTIYLTLVGSHAYGTSDVHTQVKSDRDYYGICIPPKQMIFPHLAGHIIGFGKQRDKFEQYQQHHIIYNEVEHDLQIYNIVKYFELCRQNNPSVLDSLFVPLSCIQHCSQVGQMIRDNRHLFLSQQIWPRYRGYSFAQLHKMQSINREGKRKDIVERFGYDTKYASHVVRLLLEAEQLIRFGDLDLTKDSEVVKSVKRGEWTAEQVKEWAREKDISLQEALNKTDLPKNPPEDKLRDLLLNCLEQHYGKLDFIPSNIKLVELLDETRELLDKIVSIGNG